MSELTHKDLKWFQLANANPPIGFYSFKARFLKRFAKLDGYDLQSIDKTCWTCDGTGQYEKGQTCWSCDGSGIHHTSEHWLERLDLSGSIYHVPVDHAALYHQNGFKYPTPLREIEGTITKGIHTTNGLFKPTEDAARRSFYRLLLRHEPCNFYSVVVDGIKRKMGHYRVKLYFKLIRLRNAMDLFPSVKNDDVPF